MDTLSAIAAKALVRQLKLGTDGKRLEKLVAMAEEGDLALSRCINEGNVQDALQEFSAFRSRVNKKAVEQGVPFAIEVDSKKQTPPEQRLCWFVGTDPLAGRVDAYSEAVTADVADGAIPAKGIVTSSTALQSGKKFVRFFLSYAHDERKLSDALVEQLERQFKASKKYQFSLWTDGQIELGAKWHDSIQRAIKDCDFGLLMVSPAFLGSGYIKENELPPLIGRAIPVGLTRVDFELQDLRGLEERQIFLQKAKVFDGMRSPHDKREFVHALYREIEKRLDSHFKSKPDLPEEELVPSPDEEVEHFARTRGHRFAFRDVEKLKTDRTALGEPRDACEEIEAWAVDPRAPRFFALLGEYGIGKTTTLKHLTRDLKEKHKKNRAVPLPIYIDLRDYQGSKDEAPTIEDLLTSVIRRAWRFTDRTLEARDVLHLVREEGALIIFDGLDEKIVHMTPDVGRAFVRTLWSALGNSEKGKLLVSCRSHYFRDVQSQNSMLSGDDREGIKRAEFPAFCLLPFTEAQIKEYLRAFLGDGARAEEAFGLLEKIHNLRDLAERPYLLSLIAGRLGELEQFQARGETVNAARLYDLIVKSWLNRDDGKHQLDPLHKRRLMEDIAAEMWRDGLKQWDVDRLEDWLEKRLYQSAEYAGLYSPEKRAVLKEDLRTATFVLRPDTEEKHFRFAHTSLQEFFLASYLVRALKEGKAERWDLPRASWETFDFVGQLLGLEGLGAEGLSGLLEGGALRAAVQAFGYWVRAVENGYAKPAPQRVRLAGADLEDWAIRDLDLRGADLRGVKLNRARVGRVDISGADVTGLEAREALFVDVVARDLVGDGGDLGRPQWRGGSVCGGVRLGKAKARRSNNGDAVTAFGHSSLVSACAWSPDGRFLVSGSSDKTLRVWEADSGKCLRTLAGHSSAVMACAWSPDGRFLVSGSDDKTLRVWEADSGKCLRTLEGHSSAVRACAWSPDGRFLVSGSSDKTLRVWEADSGKCLRTLAGHSSSVYACAWSPDGRFLVSGSSDNTLRVWEADSGKCLRTLEGHSDSVMACAWSPDGRFLVSGSYDKTLRVWEADSGKCVRTLAGHSDSVYACAWSPDGRFLVSGSDDKTLRVWEADSGKCLRTLEGHSDSVMACAWSPDGRFLVSGSYDKTLRVWEADSGKCLRTLEGHSDSVMACAWSPDGRFLVSGSSDNTLRVWEADSGKCLRTLEGHSDSVMACAWSPDGRFLVSGSYDKTLRVWEADSGKCVRTLAGHSDSVYACAWSPDGRFLVSGSDDKTLRVWEADSGKCLRTLEGHSDSVMACAWSPDGRFLVSGSSDKTLRVWEADSGKCLRTLAGHSSLVMACAWSPDGRFLVSGSYDKTLRVWEADSGKCLRTLEGHSDSVRACAWSPDGRFLVSGSYDNTLRVWEADSGKCVRTLEGHSNSVMACAWSPDSRRIVSGSPDCSMRVWDAESGECLSEEWNLPEGNYASIGGNRFLHASPEAWRWLGWRVVEDGRTKILPCETFGPVPGLARALRS